MQPPPAGPRPSQHPREEPDEHPRPTAPATHPRPGPQAVRGPALAAARCRLPRIRGRARRTRRHPGRAVRARDRRPDGPAPPEGRRSPGRPGRGARGGYRVRRGRGPATGAPTGNAALVDGARTAEVTAAALTGLERLYGYSYERIDDDFAAAAEVLDEPMAQAWNSVADVTKQAAVQTKTSTSLQVSDIGVTRLDGDRAAVLAFGTVTVTRDGADAGTSAGRISANLQRQGDRWVFTDIQDAGGADETR